MNTDNSKVSGGELEIEILTRLCGWTDIDRAGCYGLPSPNSVLFPLPAISTDETDAVRWIVPQLQARGLELVVSWPVDDRPRAQIFRVPEPMALFSEQGETAAEAVCLVALEYIRAQLEGK